jgi:chorismate dehydratase
LNSPRIGCVKYSNARPLIRGWGGDVDFDHPSALCNKLARGELDVALASSFEFLRNPVYSAVNDICISSDGPVYSVFVAHRGNISEIEEIELDPASETSANLLRCLLSELNLKARLLRNMDLQSVSPAGLQPADSPPVQRPESHTAENISAGRTGKMPMFRAQLLIGDQAIRFRQRHAGEFQFWDLGEQWKKLSGLPFVYALWMIRPKVVDAKQIADRLRALRDANLAHLDELIAEVVAGDADPRPEKEFTPKFFSRYYREHLRFSFGKKEMQGLQTFAKLCEKHGLLSKRDFILDLV